MWVIYFSNMIQFVMLWKVNFFNKINGLTIAVYIHMTKIQFVSQGLRVYHWLYISRKVEFVFILKCSKFWNISRFRFQSHLLWVRKIWFLSEWIADLSNEFHASILGFLISHIFSLVLSFFFQDPVVFLCLLGFHLVPGFVLFCLYQLSVTVKSHFITPLVYKK